MPREILLETPDYTVALFAAEIPVRGEGFLVVRRCCAGALESALSAGVERLRGLGASVITAANQSEEEPFLGDLMFVGPYILRHRHTLEIMELPLGVRPPCPAAPPLSMEPLSTENADAFIALNNSAMCDAPNATTYTREDTGAMLDGTSPLLGLVFRLDGTPVAMGELNRASGDGPEIAAVAVAREYRRQGVSRRAVSMMLELLAQLGFERATLKVSTANPTAKLLYLDMGFRTVGEFSKWYNIE